MKFRLFARAVDKIGFLSLSFLVKGENRLKEPKSDTKSPAGLRVLIVDDNDMLRSFLRDMLKFHSHKIVAETDGLDDTVKAYQEHAPDLVTLDLSLSQTNGLEVLAALRKVDRRAKVLIVSGNNQKRIRQQALATGADGFLAKPFTTRELMSAIALLFPL